MRESGKGNADHDQGNTDEHTIIDLICQPSGDEISESPGQCTRQQHLPSLKGGERHDALQE